MIAVILGCRGRFDEERQCDSCETQASYLCDVASGSWKSDDTLYGYSVMEN